MHSPIHIKYNKFILHISQYLRQYSMDLGLLVNAP